MRDDRPSMTAAVVALARGAASGADPITRNMVGRRYRPWLEAIAAPGLRGALARQAMRVWTFGLTDHMRLRTAAIDAAVHRAVRGGVRQVVLLGAGLDARAWRLECLREAVVFELDHPASQAFKRRRTAGTTPLAAAVHLVPVDFNRDTLAEVLLPAGFDLHAPTAWVWEGVTMYLPEAATEATLRAIAALSAPGSRLAMTYMLPRVFASPLVPQQVIHALFGIIEEPLIGGLSPQRVVELLRDAGLEPLQDGNSTDWARVFGGPSATALFFKGERLVVAAAQGTRRP